MLQYSLTYNQMFNFTPPPIWRICRNSVKSAIRNVIDGVHLLCMPSFFAVVPFVHASKQCENVCELVGSSQIIKT